VSSGRQFRVELELLEHAVNDADRETVRQQATKVENAYQALRRAYLGVKQNDVTLVSPPPATLVGQSTTKAGD